MKLNELFHLYLTKQNVEKAALPPTAVEKRPRNKVKQAPKIVQSLEPVLIDPTKPRNQEDWNAV